VKAPQPRLVAGALVLVILAVIAAFLVPPYAANWRLQSSINDLADDPSTARLPVEAVRARVLNEAANLGIPVRAEDVRIANTQGRLKIDVLYIVNVDIAGYTVDLHFRPAAGG
jgi:hypothetical protein